ncbi:Proline-, glutamic acid- and leucine-rich protein 1 [Stygiomarasmius scandens]|uniref:Proline-, glutamic acid- and leucine-rich protein 1 n=1 Tax=Marasmiellus scandens TaxID=2682957 RepID=A0ABR1JBG1_9AGAR
MSGRNPYTQSDDRYLVGYLAAHSHEKNRSGNAIYKQLAENAEGKWPWSRRHSWQSWRDHYAKNKYSFDVAIRKHLKKRTSSSSQDDASSQARTNSRTQSDGPTAAQKKRKRESNGNGGGDPDKRARVNSGGNQAMRVSEKKEKVKAKASEDRGEGSSRALVSQTTEAKPSKPRVEEEDEPPRRLDSVPPNDYTGEIFDRDEDEDEDEEDDREVGRMLSDPADVDAEVEEEEPEPAITIHKGKGKAKATDVHTTGYVQDQEQLYPSLHDLPNPKTLVPQKKRSKSTQTSAGSSPARTPNNTNLVSVRLPSANTSSQPAAKYLNPQFLSRRSIGSNSNKSSAGGGHSTDSGSRPRSSKFREQARDAEAEAEAETGTEVPPPSTPGLASSTSTSVTTKRNEGITAAVRNVLARGEVDAGPGDVPKTKNKEERLVNGTGASSSSGSSSSASTSTARPKPNPNSSTAAAYRKAPVKLVEGPFGERRFVGGSKSVRRKRGDDASGSESGSSSGEEPRKEAKLNGQLNLSPSSFGKKVTAKEKEEERGREKAKLKSIRVYTRRKPGVVRQEFEDEDEDEDVQMGEPADDESEGVKRDHMDIDVDSDQLEYVDDEDIDRGRGLLNGNGDVQDDGGEEEADVEEEEAQQADEEEEDDDEELPLVPKPLTRRPKGRDTRRVAEITPTVTDQDVSSDEDVPTTEPVSSGEEEAGEEEEEEEYYDGPLFTQVDDDQQDQNQYQSALARPFELSSQRKPQLSSRSHSPAPTEPTSLPNTPPRDRNLARSTGPNSNSNSMSISQLVSPNSVKRVIKAISRIEETIDKGTPSSRAQAYENLKEFLADIEVKKREMAVERKGLAVERKGLEEKGEELDTKRKELAKERKMLERVLEMAREKEREREEEEGEEEQERFISDAKANAYRDQGSPMPTSTKLKEMPLPGTESPDTTSNANAEATSSKGVRISQDASRKQAPRHSGPQIFAPPEMVHDVLDRFNVPSTGPSKRRASAPQPPPRGLPDTPSFADTYESTVVHSTSASTKDKGKGKAKARDVFDDDSSGSGSRRRHSSVAVAVEGGSFRDPNLAVPRVDLQKMYIRSKLQDKQRRASLPATTSGSGPSSSSTVADGDGDVGNRELSLSTSHMPSVSSLRGRRSGPGHDTSNSPSFFSIATPTSSSMIQLSESEITQLINDKIDIMALKYDVSADLVRNVWNKVGNVNDTEGILTVIRDAASRRNSVPNSLAGTPSLSHEESNGGGGGGQRLSLSLVERMLAVPDVPPQPQVRARVVSAFAGPSIRRSSDVHMSTPNSQPKPNLTRPSSQLQSQSRPSQSMSRPQTQEKPHPKVNVDADVNDRLRQLQPQPKPEPKPRQSISNTVHIKANHRVSGAAQAAASGSGSSPRPGSASKNVTGGAATANPSGTPLNLTPADGSGPESDYSPPRSSRAGQFSRLTRQGRKDEALERERLRAGAVTVATGSGSGLPVSDGSGKRKQRESLGANEGGVVVNGVGNTTLSPRTSGAVVEPKAQSGPGAKQWQGLLDSMPTSTSPSQVERYRELEDRFGEQFTFAVMRKFMSRARVGRQ